MIIHFILLLSKIVVNGWYNFSIYNTLNDDSDDEKELENKFQSAVLVNTMHVLEDLMLLLILYVVHQLIKPPSPREGNLKSSSILQIRER